jgi:hypothetical protein
MRYQQGFVGVIAGAIVCALTLVAPVSSWARQETTPRGRALQPPGGTVEGRVACGVANVARSFVYIPGQSFSGFTTDTGHFRLSYVPEGRYVIRVEIPDKPAFAIPNVVVTEGQTTNLGVLEFCPPPPEPEPVVLEPLPQTLETVQAAVNLLFGTREIEVPANCGGSPPINCPGGVPLNPLSRISLEQRAVSVTPTGSAYSFSSTLYMRSLTDISVTLPIAGVCGIAIDTAPGASQTITVAGTMAFASQNPGGPIDRLDGTSLQFTGLAQEDVRPTGGFGCTIVDLGLGFVINTLETMLTDHLRGGLCGVAGPELFTACPERP